MISEKTQSGVGKIYSLGESHSHGAIAEDCLAYFLQIDKANYLSSQAPELYSLALYAARNWLKHAELAEKGTSKITLLNMELVQGKTEAVFNRLRLRHAEYAFSGL